MAIIKKDRNWNILFDQIVKGNVIPVIGHELVELGNITSMQKIIEGNQGSLIRYSEQ